MRKKIALVLLLAICIPAMAKALPDPRNDSSNTGFGSLLRPGAEFLDADTERPPGDRHVAADTRLGDGLVQDVVAMVRTGQPLLDCLCRRKGRLEAGPHQVLGQECPAGIALRLCPRVQGRAVQAVIEPVGAVVSPVLVPRRSLSSATEFWFARQVEPLMPQGRVTSSPHDTTWFLNERLPV